MSGGLQMLCTLCFQPRQRCVCPDYFHAPSPMTLLPGFPQLAALPFRCKIDHSRPNPFGEPTSEPVPQMKVVGMTVVEIPARPKTKEQPE